MCVEMLHHTVSPTSRAAFIEFWNETAQGVNMFVCIAALKQRGVTLLPAVFWAFMRKPNDSWETSNSHAPSILSWCIQVERTPPLLSISLSHSHYPVNGESGVSLAADCISGCARNIAHASDSRKRAELCQESAVDRIPRRPPCHHYPSTTQLHH